MKNIESAIKTHQDLIKWIAILAAFAILAAGLFAGTAKAAPNEKTAAEYEAEIAALRTELDAVIAERNEARADDNDTSQQIDDLHQQIDDLKQEIARKDEALAASETEKEELRLHIADIEEALKTTEEDRDRTAAELSRWKDRFSIQHIAVLEIRRRGKLFGAESVICASIPVTPEEAVMLDNMSTVSQPLPFLTVPSGNFLTDWSVTVTHVYPTVTEFT